MSDRILRHALRDRSVVLVSETDFHGEESFVIGHIGFPPMFESRSRRIAEAAFAEFERAGSLDGFEW